MELPALSGAARSRAARPRQRRTSYRDLAPRDHFVAVVGDPQPAFPPELWRPWTDRHVWTALDVAPDEWPASADARFALGPDPKERSSS
jgi:hypothetical protein